jgi:hypothetical protein
MTGTPCSGAGPYTDLLSRMTVSKVGMPSACTRLM